MSSGACTPQFPDDIDTSLTPPPQYYESHFFSHQDVYKLGSKFYSTLYKHCESSNGTKSPLILDGTHDNLLYALRVYNAYNAAPGELDKSLKLIVMIREPMSRELHLFNKNQSASSSMSFEDYAEHILKPKVLAERKSKHHETVDQLPLWTKYFQRSQLLVLSYDELEYNRHRLAWRIQKFLDMKLNGAILADDDGNAAARHIPPKANEVLDALFWTKNMELYHWLHDNRGPMMEQVPFIEFEYGMSEELVLPNVLLVGAQFSGVSLVSNLDCC